MNTGAVLESKSVSPGKPGPTEHQLGVLVAIALHQKEHRMPPTMAEVGRVVGITKTAIFQTVGRLRRDGYLRNQLTPNSPRVLALTRRGEDLVRPLLRTRPNPNQ